MTAVSLVGLLNSLPFRPAVHLLQRRQLRSVNFNMCANLGFPLRSCLAQTNKWNAWAGILQAFLSGRTGTRPSTGAAGSTIVSGVDTVTKSGVVAVSK
jgi:hypothetical protein